MKRQLKGIAILLLSILLMLGFTVGLDHIEENFFTWQHCFVVLGLVGAVIVFLPEKSGK